MTSTVFYRDDPKGVVVAHDGKTVAVYKTVDELIETHIKGLLAIHERDAGPVMELLRKYRTPSGIGR